jgi:hypothetical protein
MSRTLLLLSLLLAGCSNPESALQSSLDQYARLTATSPSSDLRSVLSGNALAAALESRNLLTELGQLQIGEASFQILKIQSESKALVCLDVSKIQFENQSGEIVQNPIRQEKVELAVTFQKIGPKALISDFQLTGQKC